MKRFGFGSFIISYIDFDVCAVCCMSFIVTFTGFRYVL